MAAAGVAGDGPRRPGRLRVGDRGTDRGRQEVGRAARGRERPAHDAACARSRRRRRGPGIDVAEQAEAGAPGGQHRGPQPVHRLEQRHGALRVVGPQARHGVLPVQEEVVRRRRRRGDVEGAVGRRRQRDRRDGDVLQARHGLPGGLLVGDVLLDRGGLGERILAGDRQVEDAVLEHLRIGHAQRTAACLGPLPLGGREVPDGEEAGREVALREGGRRLAPGVVEQRLARSDAPGVPEDAVQPLEGGGAAAQGGGVELRAVPRPEVVRAVAVEVAQESDELPAACLRRLEPQGDAVRADRPHAGLRSVRPRHDVRVAGAGPRRACDPPPARQSHGRGHELAADADLERHSRCDGDPGRADAHREPGVDRDVAGRLPRLLPGLHLEAGAAREHELPGGLEVVADAVERRQVGVAVRAPATARRRTAAARLVRRVVVGLAVLVHAVRLEHQHALVRARGQARVERRPDVDVGRDGLTRLLVRRARAGAAEAHPEPERVHPFLRPVRDLAPAAQVDLHQRPDRAPDGRHRGAVVADEDLLGRRVQHDGRLAARGLGRSRHDERLALHPARGEAGLPEQAGAPVVEDGGLAPTQGRERGAVVLSGGPDGGDGRPHGRVAVLLLEEAEESERVVRPLEETRLPLVDPLGVVRAGRVRRRLVRPGCRPVRRPGGEALLRPHVVSRRVASTSALLEVQAVVHLVAEGSSEVLPRDLRERREEPHEAHVRRG